MEIIFYDLNDGPLIMVSAVVSQVILARFCTVEHISKKSAFYFWRHKWSKKFQLRRKVHFLWVGLLFYLLLLMTSQRKLFFDRNMLDCTKTSRKTWDITVETTVKFDYKLNVEPFATTELYNYQVVSVWKCFLIFW